MSRSFGTGSPVWFRCWRDRRGEGDDHVVRLTGNVKPYNRRGAVGSRSSSYTREYRCSCGHVGWSNHMDLERLEARG